MATTRRLKEPSEKIVEGVKLAEVKPELVKNAYRDIKTIHDRMSSPPMTLADEDSLDLEGMISSLVQWYRLTVEEDQLCDCTTCGGDSDARLDACPYCGDTETETEVLAEEPEAEVGSAPEAPEAKGKGKGKGKAKADETSEPILSDDVIIDKGAAAEEQLDQAIERVETLKRDSARNLWQLGREIAAILDSRLWRTRMNNGVVAYKTFAEFCKAELRLGYGHCNKLMNVAKQFDEETMQKIGVAKCAIMLTVPKEMRGPLLEEAPKMSRTELSERAREASDKEVRPRVGHITVAMVPGIVEIPMLARPKGKPNPNKADGAPAKSLADEPRCMERLPNGIHVYYNLVKGDGGQIVLKIDRRRVKADEFFGDEEEIGDDSEEFEEIEFEEPAIEEVEETEVVEVKPKKPSGKKKKASKKPSGKRNASPADKKNKG